MGDGARRASGWRATSVRGADRGDATGDGRRVSAEWGPTGGAWKCASARSDSRVQSRTTRLSMRTDVPPIGD
jgi:hypothetical protein